MSVQIDEKTEITVPLKTLISVVSALLVASWYVFATQNKIADLEHAQKIADEFNINYIFKGAGNEYQRIAELKK